MLVRLLLRLLLLLLLLLLQRVMEAARQSRPVRSRFREVTGFLRSAAKWFWCVLGK